MFSKKALRNLLAGACLLPLSAISVAAEYDLMLASTTPSTSHWAKTLETFQQLAAQYSDGQVNVNTSFGGALGNDTQLLQKTQLGSSVQGAYSSGANLGSVVNVMRTFDIPYIVSDAQKSLDLFYPNGQLGGPVVDELQKHMAKKNLHLLYVVPFEFRGILTTEKPVHSPEDMQGLKIRVTPSAVERDMITQLGAGATTLGISEVYTALQTGTVDGLAIPPITSVAFALGEVGKQFNMLNFQPHGSFMTINQKVWEKMPADLQAKVQQAADEAVMTSRPLYDEALEKALIKLKEQNVNVYVPSAEEQQKFADLITASATAIATKDFSSEEMEFVNVLKREISNQM